ncbi:MAG: hypothetical protein ACYDEU_09200 [Vulcanimicrobiaceae bacterium]
MKYIAILALTAMVGATTSFAVAQNAPPRPSPAMRQQMKQMHRQMVQIRRTERAQMLEALTPAHRALLASIAGQLATATQPNLRSAEHRLDAALSPAESQAILGAVKSAHEKMHALWIAARKQLMAAHAKMHPKKPDAGRLLLRLTAPGGGMMMPMRPGMMMRH